VKALRGGSDEYKRMRAEYETNQSALVVALKGLAARQAAWEEMIKAPNWTVLETISATSKAGSTLTQQPDGSLLASGKNPTPEIYKVTARTSLPRVTALRLEVISDSRLPANGPGRAANGNFVLSEFRVSAMPADGKGKPVPIHFARAASDIDQEEYYAKYAIDGLPDTGWAIGPAFGRSHFAVFESKSAVDLPPGGTLTFELEQNLNFGLHNIGRFRLSATSTKTPIRVDPLPDNVSALLAVAREKRSPEQKAQLAQYYRTIDADVRRIKDELARHPLPPDVRLIGAQDLAWALLNSPGFLFNH
jgi:hypothetical protein